MAKETTIEHPPQGHVGLWAYDPVNNRWQAIYADADGNLQVDVVASGLPSGAATALNQTTMITSLQVTEDLVKALSSNPAGDDLRVREQGTVTVRASGGDKIFSFESIVEGAYQNTNLDAGINMLPGGTVPAGKVWKLTHGTIRYDGTSPTSVAIVAYGLAGNISVLRVLAPTSTQWYLWDGEMYLQNPDYLSADVVGATAGDTLLFRYAGVQMDAP
uniref:Uncharacterized protein n=1 Tax=viral metagenome TaxID=1070528 RepID=A0A6H2A0L8_9ZZZZ